MRAGNRADIVFIRRIKFARLFHNQVKYFIDRTCEGFLCLRLAELFLGIVLGFIL